MSKQPAERTPAGQILKRARERAGISGAEHVRRINASRSLITAIDTGQCLPSRFIACLICRSVPMTADEIRVCFDEWSRPARAEVEIWGNFFEECLKNVREANE